MIDDMDYYGLYYRSTNWRIFLPLSLIIIGVGKAIFSMITELDTDEKNLVDSNKRKSIRDLVQLFLFLTK